MHTSLAARGWLFRDDAADRKVLVGLAWSPALGDGCNRAAATDRRLLGNKTLEKERAKRFKMGFALAWIDSLDWRSDAGKPGSELSDLRGPRDAFRSNPPANPGRR